MSRIPLSASSDQTIFADVAERTRRAEFARDVAERAARHHIADQAETVAGPDIRAGSWRLVERDGNLVALHDDGHFRVLANR